MNAATRKKLLAYAIPVDLVVVATGVGLLVPGIPAIAIIGVYVVAVALSAWKSGWIGAFAAIVLSSGLLSCLFKSSCSASRSGCRRWRRARLDPARGAAARRVAAIGAHTDALILPEPMIAGPRSIEEAASEEIIDPRHVAEREARRARTGSGSPRSASPREGEIEAGHAERLKAARAEFQADYDNERRAR